jgi:23S rRNA (cytosine1962-C5)-methyltransferase
MTDRTVVLRKGKDKPIRNRHHWIFSGAVESLPEGLIDGGLYPVSSHDGAPLGYAYFNRKCSIIGRIVSFGPGDPFTALRKNVQRAIAVRNELFGDGKETNAYRLINAEGDGIPGLIVDKYDTTLVIQIATLGMEKLRDFIVETLVQELGPASIYEKSNLPSRREEGLGDKAGFLFGGQVEKVFIRENGFDFLVDIAESQKTGFYLDQREMRKLAGSLASGRRVLNCFSYTGGFSVYALLGGAVRVDSVDISGPALELAKQNFRLNGLPPEEHGFIEADVFAFLRGPVSDYDLIILDPPAFAKRKADVRQAGRGYKDINRLALQKVSAGGFVLTFSCSHFVDERLFQQIVFEAAAEASRNVRILQRHRQASDHPVNIFHPETEYLKGLLLYVD